MKNNFKRLVALSWGSVVGTLCTVATVQPANAITFVLDFKNPNTQGSTFDTFGIEVGSFDVTDFGFSSSEFGTVTNAIFNKVQSHYSDIPTASEYTGTTTSPIPDGQELDINFEIADLLPSDTTIDFTPANAADAADPGTGIGDFYFVQIGDLIDNNGAFTGTSAGFARDEAARNSAGDANPFNFTGNNAESFAVASIFTDVINTVTTPSSPNENILTDPPGDLDATVNAIAGTISHEIAHTLSLLDHIYTDAAETDGGVPPIMASTSTGLTSDNRISDRAFSFSAFTEASGGGTEENYVDDLVTVIGTRNSASASVPFEFSPSMGLFLIGGTWGIASVRKKSQQKNQLKK